MRNKRAWLCTVLLGLVFTASLNAEDVKFSLLPAKTNVMEFEFIKGKQRFNITLEKEKKYWNGYIDELQQLRRILDDYHNGREMNTILSSLGDILCAHTMENGMRNAAVGMLVFSRSMVPQKLRMSFYERSGDDSFEETMKKHAVLFEYALSAKEIDAIAMEIAEARDRPGADKGRIFQDDDSVDDLFKGL